MQDQYRNKLWIEFREEVIELDGGACVRCGKTRESGAILQVHHKEYIKGKAPWEYPPKLCETLCKGCHASEHGEIRPETGWEYVGEDDLGGLYGACDRCGTEIRYVFFVHHPHWEPISVGTFCCDDLTGTKIASDKRKHDDRLKRFLKSKRWIGNSGSYVIRQKQIDIRIVPVTGGYRLNMNNTRGQTVYCSVEAAKTKAFDFIDSGDADAYFRKKDR